MEKKQRLEKKQEEIRGFLEEYNKSPHRPLRRLTLHCLEEAVKATSEAEYLAAIQKMDRDEGPLLDVFFGLPLDLE